MSPTLISLTAFISWSLALLVLMEAIRTGLIAANKVKANELDPQNSNLSPFMQRLARAHANCVEGVPIFGGLMLVALISANEQITDPLAMEFLAARVVQSIIHIASLSVLAITLRFLAFVVQMVIACVWAYGLMMLW